MKLAEFARAVKKDNAYVISVVKHKTARKGPAHIACTEKIFNLLKLYVTHFRNKLEGISTSPQNTVFVSWNGGAMDSSLITTQFGTLWKRALGDIRLKLNPTLVRKYSTSTVRGNVPEIKQVTANLVCHSLKIAEKNYALFDKQAAVKASAALKDVQRKNFKEITQYDEIPLDEIFEKEIFNESIKISTVREVIAKEVEYFKNFAVNEKFQKKILDSVRYIIQSKRKCIREEPREEESDLRDITDTATEGNTSISERDEGKALVLPGAVRNRKAYNHSDMELIYKHLGHFINSDEPLLKNDFTKYVNEIKELEELVKKFEINSFLVKMRTERKNR